jgi:hypothetical protein
MLRTLHDAQLLGVAAQQLHNMLPASCKLLSHENAVRIRVLYLQASCQPTLPPALA